MRSPFLWVVVLSISASSMNAATIIGVTGPEIDGGAIETSQSLGSSWTQTIGYSNVVVSAVLKEDTLCLADCPLITLTAYLTTQIGPGTTAADEITHAAVAFSGGSYADLNLLTIPLLSPGTYYLTLFSSDAPGAVWAEAVPPNVFLDTGVSRNQDFYVSGPVGYPPANAVLRPPIAGDFQFSATGTAIGTAAIPEPPTSTLVGAAFLTFFLKRYAPQ